MENQPEITTLKSSVNVTDDREACTYCWYAARTQINCERKAEKEFQQFAVETYLPVQEEIHQWSDRKKKIRRVVIPAILFVKMNCAEVTRVHRSHYFYGFLSYDGRGTTPAPIPDEDIEVLRFMLGQADSPVSVESMPMKVGDRVRIVRGRLQGLVGNVVACQDGATCVVVNMNLLGCAKVCVDMGSVMVV